MRLVGLIAFFDEVAGDLVRCVDDLARLGVTDVIAADGAYSLFPDAQAASCNDMSVRDALCLATTRHGMGLTIYTPRTPYACNEVAKRQLMLNLALATTTPDDWIVWCDADFHVEDGARDLKPDLEVLGAAGARWADVLINDSTEPVLGWYTLRLLWRAVPGMRFTTNHYTLKWPDGVTTIVQPKQHDARGHQLGVRIRHKPNDRAPGRRDRQRIYYENREREGVER